jgi:hypothetical protein
MDPPRIKKGLCAHISRPPQDMRFLFGALRLGQASVELQNLTTFGNDKRVKSFLSSSPKFSEMLLFLSSLPREVLTRGAC